MANTFTADQDVRPFGVMGNKRFVGGVLTMTDGNGDVATGLERVTFGFVSPKTCVTGGYGVTWNSSTAGNVSIRSCASGDTFNIGAWGW